VSTKAKEYKSKKLKVKSKFSTRVYNRCQVCGRSGGYFRLFGLCRICLRNKAFKGELPGVTKASW
jgi:small subunit ribosomal protein S14